MLNNLTSIVSRGATRLRGLGPTPERLDRQIQVLQAQQLQDRIRRGETLPSFEEVEFSSYAQNGEDGILLLIFTAIGMGRKQVVEACAGSGIECNAANLIINHGWDGLLFDGSGQKIAIGKAFYAQRNNAWRLRRLPPKLVKAWITVDNINDLIAANGMKGEIDLLSLDMDGVDYWIWKAITGISPRVVVLEYNNRWAADQSVTVPYKNDFESESSPSSSGYFGASLLAYTRLARQKGYRLIGANSPNTNAFFMRNDVGKELFPEVSVESCLSSDYARFQNATKHPETRGTLVEIP
jgi:hypothetical protein